MLLETAAKDALRAGFDIVYFTTAEGESTRFLRGDIHFSSKPPSVDLIGPMLDMLI